MTPSQTQTDRAHGEHWHTWTAEKTLAHFHSTLSGLTAQEAARRLAEDGPNTLHEGKRIKPWRIFLAQFQSLVIGILIGAGIVSGILGEIVDAAAILAIVLLNAVIGFSQEYNAEKSIAALKSMSSPQAKVLRDGAACTIPASDVVTGDILLLEAGDLIAADGRIVEAASLRCVEAALTGESAAVRKLPAPLEQEGVPLGDRENMVFMGTSVAAGTARAVVVATAMLSEMGRIAGLIEEADSEKRTPLQAKLDSFGRVLIWVALGIVTLLFALGLLRHVKLFDLFMTSISLAVAAVPEGLPAVVTVALSLGAMRMARRGALVRKLSAVETLGSTSVICTDKTGTLTVGQMSARALYVAGKNYEVTGEGYGPRGEVRFEGKKVDDTHTVPLLELATILIGCNNAHLVQEDGVWKAVGDPTEGALLSAGAKAGGDRERIERDMPVRQAIPFDSDRKRSSAIRTMPVSRADAPSLRVPGSLRALVNGAPGPLIQRCTARYTTDGVVPLTQKDRDELLAQTSKMANQALRVLGSAYRDLPDQASGDWNADEVEQDLVFVGLTGMYDPPRPEARDAIAKCRAAGIRVVMITGDHPETAAAIAGELGIARDLAAVPGSELDNLSDEELRAKAPDVSVYARVTAEHKLRIVRALRANGDVAAMTGDGVNDAPAVTGADIGIAMGTAGTEVTKQAADMIITDDNFATIVAAVEEGRGIFDNIRKTLQYLLAGNTGELLLMTICVAVGLPSPLLPIHLLWINLVTDGFPALCLATDPIDPDVMSRKPRARTERITDRRFLSSMAFTGVLTAGVTFAVYLAALRTGSVETARGSAFTVLVFAELLRSFGVRSETKPVWRIPLFTNVNLVLVVAVSFGVQVLSQHTAMLGRFLQTPYMPFQDCLLLLVIGAIPTLILECVKVYRTAKGKGRPSPSAG